MIGPLLYAAVLVGSTLLGWTGVVEAQRRWQHPMKTLDPGLGQKVRACRWRRPWRSAVGLEQEPLRWRSKWTGRMRWRAERQRWRQTCVSWWVEEGEGAAVEEGDEWMRWTGLR